MHDWRSGNKWAVTALKEGYHKLTEDLAYILGVAMGDGSITLPKRKKRDGYDGGGTIRLETKDKDFAKEFVRACESQFGVHVSIRLGKPERILVSPTNGKQYIAKPTVRATMCSADASIWVKSLCTTDQIRKMDLPLQIAWLRGFWDSEGYIDRTHYTVGIDVNSKELVELYRDILAELGIPAKLSQITSVRFRVSFTRKELVRKFFETVSPTIRRKREVFEEALKDV